MTRRLASLIALALLATAGAGCGDDTTGVPGCTTNADCPGGRVCLEGRCVASADAVDGDDDADDGTADLAEGGCPAARSCSGGTVCCAEGEECVDGYLCLPVCSAVRCGDSGRLCCASGQVCLDGVVCAADCAADRELCGADLDVCCPPGELCLADACTVPGDLCGDDFDCRDDALYCEPAIARCLPTPPPPVCEVRPEFDRVALEAEWHFDGVEVGGLVYDQVIVAPVVADVSGDGVPDVVVQVYRGTAWSTAVLVALSGDDGHVLWTVGRGADAPDGEGIALADFDPSDPAAEIAYRLDTGGVRLLDGDGVTELGRRADLAAQRGTLEVADVNGDGVPDLVLGCRVLDGSDLSVDLGVAAGCTGSSFYAPSVADLDGDGFPEVVLGGGAWDPRDGLVQYLTGSWDGLTAVADLDLDGTPEVVLVRSGSLQVLSGADGSVLVGPAGAWAAGTFAIPGGGTGGAPTVADFDGDGLPEIATAGQGAYAVYDPDCLPTPPRSGGDACTTTAFLRWQVPTQDLSSSVTGSSVFDFQGDGAAEVIYNDECFLHVFDGTTGEDVLAAPIPNSSRTGYEYPIVVDVDADGNSEIVVVANNDQAVARDNCPTAYSRAFGVPVADLPAEYARGTKGVFVYGDPGDRWVGTRPIWNQYSYHVTNVGPAGEVPATELDNWSVSGLNNYRQNVQGSGIFNAPDLQVTLEAAAACADRTLRLSAVVRNAGSRGVPAGVLVEFRRTAPAPEETVGTAATTTPLLPGGSERVTVIVADVPLDVDLAYEVLVDGAGGAGSPGAVVECLEDNNRAEDDGRCPALI